MTTEYRNLLDQKYHAMRAGLAADVARLNRAILLHPVVTRDEE